VPEPSEWLERIAELLDGLGLAWAVMGAVAANRFRGEARFTTDLDILVQPEDRLPVAAAAAGFAVQAIADPDEPPHVIVLRDRTVRVDLLPAVVEYQQVALRRAEDHFITVEDVLVHKLIAWRGRDRDDIRSILETSPRLDLAYLRHWADVWEVTDRWSQARAESGYPPHP
jgi:hypothetical protein